MKADLIYVSKDGIPMALIKPYPSGSHSIEKIRECKKACVPIREEDIHLVQKMTEQDEFEKDTFYESGSYYFELDEVKFEFIARIIRRPELYSIIQLEWKVRKEGRRETWFGWINGFPEYVVGIQTTRNNVDGYYWYPVDGDIEQCESVEEGIRKSNDHHNSRVKQFLNYEAY